MPVASAEAPRAVCGRYSLALGDPVGLRARFPLGEALEIPRRFNVAPGDEVLAVIDSSSGPHGEMLRWGLVPHWARKATDLRTINARAETVEERPAYRSAFRDSRCLILADGFYEWRRDPDGRRRAFHITLQDGAPFAFAGLWASRRSEQGVLRSCAIITTAANRAVAAIHDRMPVILPAAAEREWLDPAADPHDLREILAGAPAEAEALVLREVGPAVNDARYDGPDCLAPPVAPQPALF